MIVWHPILNHSCQKISRKRNKTKQTTKIIYKIEMMWEQNQQHFRRQKSVEEGKKFIIFTMYDCRNYVIMPVEFVINSTWFSFGTGPSIIHWLEVKQLTVLLGQTFYGNLTFSNTNKNFLVYFKNKEQCSFCWQSSLEAGKLFSGADVL